MATYAYIALDARGRETKGSLDANDQSESIRRLREMGFFPTRVVQLDDEPLPTMRGNRERQGSPRNRSRGWIRRLMERPVKPRHLTIFTRQLATLIETGMPLLRGLRILEEQEEHPGLRRVIASISQSIEGGQTLSEALARHPAVFNRLYTNMIKAGEIGGVMDIVLRRLADFMEKAQKIKGKVVAALFYPVTVILVAAVILGLLMTMVIPRFQAVFADLLGGAPLPAFTRFVLGISSGLRNHLPLVLAGIALAAGALVVAGRTGSGRAFLDRVKLALPALGSLYRKLAIARFARTLGTLVSSGVPILQALNIVKETAGNAVVGDAVSRVHASVKEGASIALPLKASGVFPAMVVGMVDVGEQSGALPETLLKIADTYDDEVDNAVSALTSLIEPLMIVFLAVIVGSIVVAMFLPLVEVMTNMDPTNTPGNEG